MNPSLHSPTICTRIADIRLEAEGLVLITFTQDAELDEACAIEILSAILTLTLGKPHCLLYDFNQKSVLLSNIAKRLASRRGPDESKLMGRAFLTYTLQNDLEAGHFIHHAKPVCETQIFRTHSAAVDWLKTRLLSR
jgi:hypothetical protein